MPCRLVACLLAPEHVHACTGSIRQMGLVLCQNCRSSWVAYLLSHGEYGAWCSLQLVCHAWLHDAE